MKKNTIKNILLVAALAAFPMFGAAGLAADLADRPVVTAKADKTEITVGDPIKYSVEAEFPKGLQVVFPALEDKLGNFDILFRSQNFGKKGFGKIEFKKLDLTISLFETGEFIIPAFPVQYVDSYGRTNVAVSKPIKVKVIELVKDPQNSEMRDLKPPAGVPDPWLWLKILLVLLLGAGIFLFIRFRYKFFKKEILSVAKPIPELSPEEEALKRLNEVVQGNILVEAGVKEYYSIINEIIRHYLFRIYGFVTLERTTDEIVDEMKKINLSKATFDIIADFLMESDLVKFAKLVPTVNEIKGFASIAFQIVEITTSSRKSAREDGE